MVCVFQQLPCAIVVVQAKNLRVLRICIRARAFYWKSLILERSERIIGSFKASFFFAILSDCSSFILFFFQIFVNFLLFLFGFSLIVLSYIFLFLCWKKKKKSRARQQQALFSFNTSLQPYSIGLYTQAYYIGRRPL